MALSRVTIDNENSKFVESPTRPNAAAVEVVGSFTPGVGPLDPPLLTDTITRQVISHTEIYRYFQGGASGTLLKTVTVHYTSSSLEDLLSVEVS